MIEVRRIKGRVFVGGTAARRGRSLQIIKVATLDMLGHLSDAPDKDDELPYHRRVAGRSGGSTARACLIS
jgi:hypothetical protein